MLVDSNVNSSRKMLIVMRNALKWKFIRNLQTVTASNDCNELIAFYLIVALHASYGPVNRYGLNNVSIETSDYLSCDSSILEIAANSSK